MAADIRRRSRRAGLVARSRETGALGAAIAAGTGVGIFSDFAEGAAAMVRTERHYRPNRALEAHMPGDTHSTGTLRMS